MRIVTVGEVARRISSQTGVTVAPHAISNLFYKRHLDVTQCPVVGQVRLIPEDYVLTIQQVLYERGTLPYPPEECNS